MSLLLFQAMLFAACTFLGHSTVEALGFPDIRTMRATYYRRAKLLHDFGTESSNLSTSQAALLLSFMTLSSTKMPNPQWLGVAIENAQLSEAHLYATFTDPSLQPHRNTLKRIWWCCVLRDYLLALLMRRPLRITHRHFDSKSPPLTIEDLADEFTRSKVYNPLTKEKLAGIVVKTVKLFVAITDILLLAFPIHDSADSVRDNNRENSIKLRDCKTALRQWYKSAASGLQKSPSETDQSILSNFDDDFDHESTILYTNIMMMYYHTARIVLCHHEVHLGLKPEVARNHSPTNALSTILGNRLELQDATSKIVEYHQDLVQRDLARWLPISAVGCTALPLILNIIDVKLSTSKKKDRDLISSLKQHRLNILIKVMRAYRPLYDGVDWISEIVRHVVTIAQLDDSMHKDQSVRVNWEDIFAFKPHLYLRLALALDLGLSKGRLPQDGDFPQHLRDLLVIDTSPPNQSVHEDYANSNDDGSRNPPDLHQETRLGEPSNPDPFHGAQDNIPSVDESTIASIEEQVYLHLAGGLAEPNLQWFRSDELNNSIFHLGDQSLSDSDKSDSPSNEGQMATGFPGCVSSQVFGMEIEGSSDKETVANAGMQTCQEVTGPDCFSGT